LAKANGNEALPILYKKLTRFIAVTFI